MTRKASITSTVHIKYSPLTLYSIIVFQAQESKEIKAEQQEQEQRVAEELCRIKLESTRDEKMRQQIRESR